jgi:hypothetical protein
VLQPSLFRFAHAPSPRSVEPGAEQEVSIGRQQPVLQVHDLQPAGGEVVELSVVLCPIGRIDPRQQQAALVGEYLARDVRQVEFIAL